MDGEVVLHGLMLGPSPGVKARGDHTRGGGVNTGHESILYILCVLNISCRLHIMYLKTCKHVYHSM